MALQVVYGNRPYGQWKEQNTDHEKSKGFGNCEKIPSKPQRDPEVEGKCPDEKKPHKSRSDPEIHTLPFALNGIKKEKSGSIINLGKL